MSSNPNNQASQNVVATNNSSSTTSTSSATSSATSWLPPGTQPMPRPPCPHGGAGLSTLSTGEGCANRGANGGGGVVGVVPEAYSIDDHRLITQQSKAHGVTQCNNTGPLEQHHTHGALAGCWSGGVGVGMTTYPATHCPSTGVNNNTNNNITPAASVNTTTPPSTLQYHGAGGGNFASHNNNGNISSPYSGGVVRGQPHHQHPGSWGQPSQEFHHQHQLQYQQQIHQHHQQLQQVGGLFPQLSPSNFPDEDTVYTNPAGGPRGMDMSVGGGKGVHDLPPSVYCQSTTSTVPPHHQLPQHHAHMQQQHPQPHHAQHAQQQQHLIVHKSSPFCLTQLPDSPPDSGSEPYSPADAQHTDHQSSCDVKASIVGSMTTLPQLSYSGGPSMAHIPAHISPPQHHSPPGLPTSDPTHLHQQQQQQQSQQQISNTPEVPNTQQQQQQQLPKSYPQYSNGEPPKLNHPPQHPMPPVSMPQIGQQMMPAQFTMNNSINNAGAHPSKKRKYPDSPTTTLSQSMLAAMPGGTLPIIKQEPSECDFTNRASSVLPLDCGDDDFTYDLSPDPGGMFLDSTYQVIKWQQYQNNKWATLLDTNFKDLPLISYRVDSDKGFNFSVPDDAFVCQKKNHFQVTVHLGMGGDAKYVKTSEGTQKVDSFFVHFNGIKSESPSQTIKVEQSQSDRSKKAFHPVKVGGFTVRPRQFSERVDLPADHVTKITVGRLHFSETTSNNMRKKGKPNPDQRYFMLVVALQAHCGENTVLVAAHVSEKIIVRASNPGQFDSDVDVLWNKGQTPDSVFHMGRVGINTDRPDEALTIHGNVRVTGHIIQPSDKRAKTDIQMIDTAEQLETVKGLNVYKYRYNQDFAEHAGLSEDELEDTGVLAQEVQDVLPDAVRDTGDIILSNGKRIENFLVVNKDRIYMENVGAVKELCKLTDNLENRIDELEQMNKKLAKLKRLDSVKSTTSTKSISSCSTMSSRMGSVIGNSTMKKAPSPQMNHHNHGQHNNTKNKQDTGAELLEPNICSNRLIQITVTVLVLVMAFCLVSITTLYILEKQKPQDNSQIDGIIPNSTWSPEDTTGLQHDNKGGGALLPSKDAVVTPLTPPRCARLESDCRVVCCPPIQPLDDPSHYNPLSSTHGKPIKSYQGEDYARSRMVKPVKPYNNFNDNSSNNKTFQYSVQTTKPSGDLGIPSILLPIPKPTQYQEPSVESPPQVMNDYPESKNKYPTVKISNNIGYYIHRQRRSANETLLEMNPKYQAIIMIHQINRTINNTFCSTDACRLGVGGNFTYTIPISSYFPVTQRVFLDFKITPNASLSLCRRQVSNACQEGYRPRVIPGSSRVQWDLPIGLYFFSNYGFRVADNDVEACMLPDFEVGRKFAEYNLYFHRVCEDAH